MSMTIETNPVKRGRGRPRKYATNAERIEAEAARRADKAALAAIAKRDKDDALKKPIEILLVTVTQAAQALQVSERTIWNLFHSGALPYVQIRGTRRIMLDELKQFASTGTQEHQRDSHELYAS
jgi:excisionase family DNA binding protein